MPVAPAEAERQVVVTHTDGQLKDLHHSVANNLHKAGVSTTYEAVKPVHVPDALPKTIVDEVKIATEKSVPGSFSSTPETALSPLGALHESLDYADQLVTGRSHVVGEAQPFAAHQAEMADKRRELKNAPREDTRGAVKKLVDWLHK